MFWHECKNHNFLFLIWIFLLMCDLMNSNVLFYWLHHLWNLINLFLICIGDSHSGRAWNTKNNLSSQNMGLEVWWQLSPILMYSYLNLTISTLVSITCYINIVGFSLFLTILIMLLSPAIPVAQTFIVHHKISLFTISQLNVVLLKIKV